MIASIILALYFLGTLPQDVAVSLLYVTAVLLILAEIGVVSLGVLALNGLLALYAAYALQTGATYFLGVQIGWGVLFGIAAVEFAILIASIMVWKKIKNIKTETGPEGMLGQKATILQWDGKSGRAQYEGEEWKAESEKYMDFTIGDKAVIKRVEKLKLIIGT